MTILFLDFDGVLHAADADDTNLFVHKLALENLLHKHPHVDVVFSTSWRRMHKLPELRKFFSEDLQHRFIGVTPFLKPGNTRLHLPYRRANEILEWIKRHRQEHPSREFVAVDDDATQFPDDCQWVLLCNKWLGLGCAQTFAQLDERLRVALKRFA